LNLELEAFNETSEKLQDAKRMLSDLEARLNVEIDSRLMGESVLSLKIKELNEMRVEQATYSEEKARLEASEAGMRLRLEATESLLISFGKDSCSCFTNSGQEESACGGREFKKSEFVVEDQKIRFDGEAEALKREMEALLPLIQTKFSAVKDQDQDARIKNEFVEKLFWEAYNAILQIKNRFLEIQELRYIETHQLLDTVSETKKALQVSNQARMGLEKDVIRIESFHERTLGLSKRSFEEAARVNADLKAHNETHIRELEASVSKTMVLVENITSEKHAAQLENVRCEEEILRWEQFWRHTQGELKKTEEVMRLEIEKQAEGFQQKEAQFASVKMDLEKTSMNLYTLVEPLRRDNMVLKARFMRAVCASSLLKVSSRRWIFLCRGSNLERKRKVHGVTRLVRQTLRLKYAYMLSRVRACVMVLKSRSRSQIPTVEVTKEVIITKEIIKEVTIEIPTVDIKREAEFKKELETQARALQKAFEEEITTERNKAQTVLEKGREELDDLRKTLTLTLEELNICKAQLDNLAEKNNEKNEREASNNKKKKKRKEMIKRIEEKRSLEAETAEMKIFRAHQKVYLILETLQRELLSEAKNQVTHQG